MFESTRRNRGSRLLRTAAAALLGSDWTLNRLDPDALRRAVTVSVWVHWFIAATCLLLLVYRPWYGPGTYAAYALLLLTLVAFNEYIHHRLASNRTLSWRWIFALCVLDAALIPACAALGGGFSHSFFHLLYYPLLAGFAAFFTSIRLNLVFVTAVAVSYLAMSLGVGDGIDPGARDEKALFARIMVMYGVVAGVNLFSRFERSRWRASVQREHALQRERVQLSQSIHDTTAQSAYMIGLGIDAAKQLAGDSNRELTARLEATSSLATLKPLPIN